MQGKEIPLCGANRLRTHGIQLATSAITVTPRDPYIIGNQVFLDPR